MADICNNNYINICPPLSHLHVLKSAKILYGEISYLHVAVSLSVYHLKAWKGDEKKTDDEVQLHIIIL